MFERDRRLQFTEIISYKADSDLKWLALTGLEPQVHSSDVNVPTVDKGLM